MLLAHGGIKNRSGREEEHWQFLVSYRLQPNQQRFKEMTHSTHKKEKHHSNGKQS